MKSNEKKLFIPWSEKSSTNTISFKSAVGDLFITEWTVLSMVVRASLWNMMITLADGNCFGYSIFKHLKLKYFNEYFKAIRIYVIFTSISCKFSSPPNPYINLLWIPYFL